MWPLALSYHPFLGGRAITVGWCVYLDWSIMHPFFSGVKCLFFLAWWLVEVLVLSHSEGCLSLLALDLGHCA